MGEISVQNFGRRTSRKELFARPRSRWEDNIRMNLREIGWEGMDWMHLA
jgi:hypothetical protein